MMPRKLYVSFARHGLFGSAYVPLLGSLDEYAVEQVARAVARQIGALPSEIVIIAITILEE